MVVAFEQNGKNSFNIQEDVIFDNVAEVFALSIGEELLFYDNINEMEENEDRVTMFLNP